MTTNILGFTALTGGGTGALDAITSSYYADGSIAFGVVSGVHYPYQYDASETGSENSPYYIIPDDNVSGTGAWVLVMPQGPFSHVSARTDAGQSIESGTAEIIIFEDEDWDDLGEYDTDTGLFTATYAGYYHVEAVMTIDSVAWGSNKSIIPYIYVDGSLNSIGPRTVIDGVTNNGAASIGKTIKLTVGQTIGVWIYQNQGSTQNLRSSSADWNWLTIDRLP